ncbi:MAG: ABC transporter permease [Bacteroidota bacterium]|nr:ABC transporter permease [Bacteroidota bacterium]
MEKNKKSKHEVLGSDIGVYWKPKSKIWVAASIATVLLALLVDVLVPNVQFVNPVSYQVFLGGFAAVLTVLWIASRYVGTIRKKLYHKAQFIFAVGIVLALWDLLTTKSGIFKLPFFPGPVQIVDVIVKERTTLLISTYYSMRLFFVGLVSGTLLGIATGILIGWYRQWYYWLFPVIKISGVIPAIAWLPIAIVLLPNSFSAGVFLIAIASWFSVAFMVSGGIASTPKVYYEAAKTLGAGESFLLFHIALPNAVPDIFSGISTATGLSFLTLIVSEMIGAKAGLGWYINWAKAWSAYDKVYASIIIMAIAFSIILAVLTVVRNYVLRWKNGIVQ